MTEVGRAEWVLDAGLGFSTSTDRQLLPEWYPLHPPGLEVEEHLSELYPENLAGAWLLDYAGPEQDFAHLLDPERFSSVLGSLPRELEQWAPEAAALLQELDDSRCLLARITNYLVKA